MKLHPLISTSQQPAGFQVSSLHALSPANGALQLQASSGCIQSCVGVTAASSCAYCGTNPSCWDGCAGAGKGACVSRCF